MGKEKVMVHFNGIMVKNFKETGKMGWNVVLVFGDLRKEIAIKVNGWIIDNMDKVFLNIEIVLIRENFKTFLNMVKGHKNLLMEIHIKVIISLESLMGLVLITGMMEEAIKDSLNQEFVMEKVN